MFQPTGHFRFPPEALSLIGFSEDQRVTVRISDDEFGLPVWLMMKWATRERPAR